MAARRPLRSPTASKAKAAAPQAPITIPPGLKLILIGVPIIIFSSYGIYKRAYLGQQKKEQLGELDTKGKLRMFTDEEVRQRDQNSWFSRIFGGK